MTCNTGGCFAKMIKIGDLYVCPSCGTSIRAKQAEKPKETVSIITRIDSARGHRGKSHFYRITPCEDHHEDACEGEK